jgi:two-component system OmpR family response regulator
MSKHSELKKILYVEDDSSIQLVARLALEDVGGMEVAVCSSGQEAVEAAAGFQPDLLLLDVMMPGLDGPATLHELRKLAATRDTPAIFMTAKVQPQEIAALKQLPGTIEVIAKPFDPLTLAAQLRKAWGSRQHKTE